MNYEEFAVRVRALGGVPLPTSAFRPGVEEWRVIIDGKVWIRQHVFLGGTRPDYFSKCLEEIIDNIEKRTAK